ncbi:MAG TPA: DUF6691 family protein [Alphaproteobacteria bacterium]
MAQMLVAAVSGIVFGLGLGVSQMVDPAKVLAFLDLAGDWDPSLAFVMGGAVAVSLVAFRYSLRRRAPLLARSFALPEVSGIDARLLAGAALFGAGWGLVGFCPGPAIASFAFGQVESALFVAAMAAGMAVANLVPGPSRRLGTTEA